ncbi:MAG: hypothetical protein QXI16_00285 [Sulfolobaceae archaeon]
MNDIDLENIATDNQMDIQTILANQKPKLDATSIILKEKIITSIFYKIIVLLFVLSLIGLSVYSIFYPSVYRIIIVSVFGLFTIFTAFRIYMRVDK